MTTQSNPYVSSEKRVLPLRLRADLTFRQHHYQGETFWVVKEPIGLKYFRFREEEYRLLRMLDGTVSLADLQDRFADEFAPQHVSLTSLHNFLGKLFRAGLVVSAASGQGHVLQHLKREQQRQKILSTLTNILVIRFPGVDPQPVLTRLIHFCGWMYTPAAVAACGLLALSALALIIVNFDVFQARLPAFNEFFNASNLFWLMLTIGVCKVAHELGHGLTCVKFGGECHSIGFMLLVFSPAMYCDVSDSWVLPSKWRRIAIGIGGMYVEVVLASIATFLWWFSKPGLFNHICLSVMFVCSVSTIIVNLNPLMRFDGYYVLSDLLEIPNLSEKSATAFRRLFFRFVFGIELGQSGYPQRKPVLFALYAMASTVYRWLLVISILLILNRMLEPYGLKVIGQTLAIVAAVVLVSRPLWQFVQTFRVPGMSQKIKWRYVASTAAVLVVLLFGIALIPLPHRIYGPIRAEFKDSSPVGVATPGILKEVFVQPGAVVAAGQPLAQLENWELQLRIVDLQRQRDELMIQLDAAKKTRFENVADVQGIKTLEKLLARAEESLREQLRDAERLTLTAPEDGVVLSPPSRYRSANSETTLASWSGSPMDRENLGTHLDAGNLFCKVGDARQVEVILVVDQADVEFVQVGQAVTLRFASYALDTTRARVAEISKRELVQTPEGLSHQAGGTLESRTDADGNQRPLSTSYVVRILVDDLSSGIREGVRGQGCIEVEPMTLSEWLWRKVARVFRFEM